MKTTPLRVGIYGRVSTSDKDQNPETQLLPLRVFVNARGWQLFDTYLDFESGRREKRHKRPGFKRLMDDARKRKFDVLLVFRYSRFARSTQDLVEALRDFEALGIDFVSYQENIDTTTSHGKFFFTVIAAFAQLESDTISENVKAGLERVRKEGKQLGRPPLSHTEQEAIISSWQASGSIKRTAKDLNKPYATVHKVVTAYKQHHPGEQTIQLELWLRVENNSKFVRGKTQSRQDIETCILSKYGMKKSDKDGYRYTLTLTYQTDEELERIIYDDILREAAALADLRHGFIEADLREIGGVERSW
jgi:DNA invertase Pin-like site-specific DNA recombinase